MDQPRRFDLGSPLTRAEAGGAVRGRAADCERGR